MGELFAAGIADFKANFLLYLSMPVVSAAVGYCTNVVAIKMMFWPLEFLGVKEPFLGWQGIVPRRAAKMAGIAVDTITASLITVDEIFNRLDPERVADELEKPMINLIEDIVGEVMAKHQPALWESLPMMVRNQIIKRIQKQAPEIVAEVMQQVKDDVHGVFDLKDMVVTNLVRDKQLLNRIFQEVGEKEFVFIGRSGAYFGLLFGTVQMGVWVFYKGAWLLPAFGLLVGYATNWLALKMIFNPRVEMKVGPVTIQGLFHKRQFEVAHSYGDLIAAEILTPANIIEAILKGPYSDKMFALVGREVQKAVDEQTGVVRPFVSFTIGSRSYQQMKEEAVDGVISRLPDTLRHVEDYAEDAMDIRNTIIERLQGLDSETFEGMLRPAFEQDEWILIAVGAALGFLVGCFQLFVMFGDQVFGDGNGEAAAESAMLMIRTMIG